MGGYSNFIENYINSVDSWNQETLVVVLKDKFSISTLEALEAIEDYLDND